MDKNDRSDLTEYLSNEITQYYGADTLKKIEQSLPPKQPVIHRSNKILSYLGIGCAVMFLTGASILFGVVFSSCISVSDGDRFHTDTIISSESDSYKAETDISQQTIFESNLLKSSSNSSINTDTENSHVQKSDSASQELLPDKHYDDTSLNRRQGYFSLSEYPKESNSQIIESDINNNSITNSYDNITTGRHARAGIGFLLMILSVFSAFALHSYSHSKNKT